MVLLKKGVIMKKLTKREDVEDIFGFGNWWIKKELFNYMVENEKELGLENLEFSKNFSF